MNSRAAVRSRPARRDVKDDTETGTVTDETFCVCESDAFADHVAAKLRETGSDFAIGMTDGVVTTVTGRAHIEEVCRSPAAPELFGNLSSIGYRICRPQDGPAVHSALLKLPGVASLVVCNEYGEPQRLLVATGKRRLPQNQP